jgi:hypothetical protein
MTDLEPLSQLEVESEIRRLSGQLTFLTQHMGTVAREAAQADVDYKRAHAKTILSLIGHEGTVAQHEAKAVEACADEMARAKIADAVWKADREQALNLRAQLAALQTLAANQRVAIDYSHGRGG